MSQKLSDLAHCLALIALLISACQPAPAATYVPLTTTPLPGIGSTMVSDRDGMVQVYVPAGEFLMGSSQADLDLAFKACPTCEFFNGEKPQHKVYLDAFWIDKTDVTNAMYAKCVQAGACQPPSDKGSETRSTYYGDSRYDNYPVIYVSWDAATAYCTWAGRRLPTEADWEKAARGMDGRKYPWGNQEPDANLLNFNNNVQDTTEVGHYQTGASPYGALDMAGNVQQWAADWYDTTYYASSPDRNPTGPTGPTKTTGGEREDNLRAMRGGDWYSRAETVRSTVRVGFNAQDAYLGFRCVR
jgi:serine/threonine-protein kinase